MEIDLNHVPKLVCELASMHYELEKINPKIERKGVMAVIVPLMLAGFCCLFMLGCGSTEAVSPEIADRAAELSSAKSMQSAMESHATAFATALAAQKLTGEMTLENTQTIIAKLNTLEASLSAPKPNGQEVIKSAPEPPAKANTAAIHSQVATPGASSETLTELATRLYSQGINVHMKTREELEAIDAQMKAGQPVTGAMFQNNRASAITSQRSAIRFVPRGSSVIQWQNYSTQSTCGPNGCPQRRSR